MSVTGEFINTCGLYYALVTEDTAAAYTAGTPVFLAPLGNIASETDATNEPRYYDGKAYFFTASEGATKITALIPGLDLKTKALLLGKKYVSASKRFADSGRNKAPWVALGYAAEVADQDGGSHLVFFWFLKGKFAPPKTEAATSTEKLDEKTTELEYTAVQTEHEFTVDGETMPLKSWGADGSLDPSVTKMSWFAAVQNPNLPSITVSAQPQDKAVTEGAITGSLSVTASASTGTLSYQWFQADSEDDYTGATPISGATGASLTIPTDLTEGVYHYFCAIYIAASNVSLSTDIATVTVS